MLVVIPELIWVQTGVREIASVISKTEFTYCLDHVIRSSSACLPTFTDPVPEEAVSGVKVDPGRWAEFDIPAGRPDTRHTHEPEPLSFLLCSQVGGRPLVGLVWGLLEPRQACAEAGD